MLDIVAFQRWLYAGAVHALDGLHSTGLAGVPALVAAALGFGLLHALMPGHGKSILTSYYAGDGRMAGAIVSSCLLIAVHVGSAIVLVLTGYALLQRTLSGAGRAPILEHASQILVLLVGCWLLWRAIRPRRHEHGRALARSAPALAVFAGLVPCPLTTFIMTYAVAHEAVAAGLMLAAAFACGMIVTVAAFPLAAVLLRERLLPLMARTETWRARIARVLETMAAVAVILLGALPLMAR